MVIDPVEMFKFMIGVMGANLFWASYIFLMFVSSAIIIKNFMPNTYVFITKGFNEAEKSPNFDIAAVAMLTIFVPLFWPAFVAVIISAWTLHTLWKIFIIILKLVFNGVDKIMPTIDIKIKSKGK